MGGPVAAPAATAAAAAAAGGRRGAAGTADMASSLDALAEHRKRELPGRRVFSLKSEHTQRKVNYVEGAAQKQELKGITGTWLSYFNDKQINAVLSDAVERMLHLLELPENPYLSLANQLRTSELSYGMARRSALNAAAQAPRRAEDDSAKDGGGKDPQQAAAAPSEFAPEEVEEECPITAATCVKGWDGAWGAANVLRATDPEELAALLWRVGSFPAVLDSAMLDKGEYQVRYATAVTGTAVFHGRLLPFLPDKIELQHDCRVEGPKFEKAVSAFAHVLIKEVEALGREANVLVVGVNVEAASYGGGKKGKSSSKQWTASKIRSSRNSFVSAVKAATVSKRRISLEFIADVPPRSEYERELQRRERSRFGSNNNYYDEDGEDVISDSGFVAHNTMDGRRGSASRGGGGGGSRQEEPGQLVEFSKLYTMHFQQTDRSGAPSGELRSFAVFPFSSFCSGVFRSKEDAQFYVELHKTPEGDCWTLAGRERYNGFRCALKASLIRHFISGNLVDAVEVLTVLLAMAGHYTVVDDVQRLMHSSAGQLRGAICWNRVICKTLEHLRESDKGDGGGGSRRRERGAHLGFSDPKFVDIVVQQFPAYRRMLLRAMLDTDSSDVITMQRPVRHALYSMCDHVSRRLVVDERVTIPRLQHVQYMCEALEQTVARDVFEVLTNPYFHSGHPSGDTLVGLIEGVTSEVINEAANRDHAQKSEGDKIKKGGAAGANSDHIDDIFNDAGVRCIEAFSSEAAAAQTARENVRVVSIPEAIKEAKKKRTVPMDIAREATLLEYVTETRLDTVIDQIALDLFTNGKLYPNPFPNVVARLRAEALRQHVWREPDSSLVKLVAGTRARIKLVDPRTWLYKFVKHDAFGVFSALRVCSGGVVSSIVRTLASSGVITPAQGPNTSALGLSGGSVPGFTSGLSGGGLKGGGRDGGSKSSAYDVSVCTSLCGNAVLYSRIHSEASGGAAAGASGTGTAAAAATVEVDEALRHNPSVSLAETHIYEGPRLQGALELFADYLVSQTLHLNDKSESNVVLCLATGLHAMDLLNADPGYDGGWYPVSNHVVHKTTDQATAVRRARGHRGSPSAAPEETAAMHSEQFYKDAQDKMYHPRYSHGEYLQVHQLRREQALCRQEIIRATKAKEPIVLELCVLVDPPGGPSGLAGRRANAAAGAVAAEAAGGDAGEEDQGSESFYIIVRKSVSFFYVATPSGQTTCFVPDFLRYDALYRSVWFDRDQASDAINAICSDNTDASAAQLVGRHLADPCDSNTMFHNYYELSLKLRVAHAYVQGDLVKAYRALFRYATLKRKAKLVPDLIRMLQRHNIALEFDMLMSNSMLIRGLFRERSRSDDSRRKLKARVLKQHFASYKESVEVLLARPECLFLPGIRNAVHALLIEVGQAIDGDRAGTSTAHLDKLEELHCYLECLRLSAATSFHRNCPHLDQLCRSFCAELLPVSEIGFLAK